MEWRRQLDSPRSSARLIPFCIFLLLAFGSVAAAQDNRASNQTVSNVKALYDAGQWEAVVQAVPESPDVPAALELYRGLALAQLKRWDEARATFKTGLIKNPRNERLHVELAGVEYRQHHFRTATKNLRHALAIEPADGYANNFAASIYFLEGNLEAALKYWNKIDEPRLADLSFDPQPRLNPIIMDRAFAFSPGAVWERNHFLATLARLEALNVFTAMRFDLQVTQPSSAEAPPSHPENTSLPQSKNGSDSDAPAERFDLVFHSIERPGWSDSKWESAVSFLRGLPYQTVYPEFYDLGHSGLNWRSLVRFDDQQRRISSEIAAPFSDDPKWRYRIYIDGRNENWNISNTLLPLAAAPAALNVQRFVAGVELISIASGRWQWNSGLEYSYRDFSNLQGIAPQSGVFFTNTSGLAYRSGITRSLIRIPEDRFTVDAAATGELGRFFAQPFGDFGRIEGSLLSTWFPQARGDDYEVQTQVRAGGTAGNVPFDELFMLGFDRDNDLWLRGHPDLRNDQKGNAPLGRDFVLVNSEADKIVHQWAFIRLRVGPFLDTGQIYDQSQYFGSPEWLWDTGVEAKIRVFGSFEFVLGYGKDLRSGTNSFFTTVTP